MTAAVGRHSFGRYRVLELLGEGANGQVFAAEDPAVGMRVALKVVRAGMGQAADLQARVSPRRRPESSEPRAAVRARDRH